MLLISIRCITFRNLILIWLDDNYLCLEFVYLEKNIFKYEPILYIIWYNILLAYIMYKSIFHIHTR